MKHWYTRLILKLLQGAGYPLFVLSWMLWCTPAVGQPTLNGQYSGGRFELSPALPSPTVAKLGVYGNIPVDNYTGVPDIKIPLYTYHFNGLEVPIYLSYHSTGLLVDEQASNVGLGWSLHAGGVIGHTIYGSNDEYANGFGLNGEKVVRPGWNSSFAVSTFFKYSAGGQFDTEPDVYNFSYGDQSGRYVLDYLGDPHTTPFKDIQITWTGDTDRTITDEHGVRYIYNGKNEQTETVYGNYCTPPPTGMLSVESRRNYISARYLTQIISPTLDTIKLAYTPTTIVTRQPADYSMTRILTAIGCSENIINNNNVPGIQPCQLASRHRGYQIASITSRNGIIVRFQYETVPRLDCVGGHRLQAIEVTDGTYTKRYELYHSYFQATQYMVGDSLTQAGQYRLRLDSVKEAGLPAYKLRYRLDTAIGFPVLGSFSQDVMGYYNGKPNTALVSKDMFTARSPLIEPAVVQGVNRTIDTVAVRQGMLERMTYPTGGYSQFTYEPHDYLVNRHFGVDSVTNQLFMQVSANDEIFAGNTHTETQRINLTQSARVRMQCSIQLPTVFTNNNIPYLHFSVVVRDSITGQAYYSMPPGPTNDSTITLPAGVYHITATAEDLSGGNVLLYVYASTLYTKDVFVQNYPFYGCRIKSIVSSGRTAYGQDLQTIYCYRLSDPQKSSGYVLYLPKLLYTKAHIEAKTQHLLEAEITRFFYCDYAVLNQSPINPVGCIHGGNVAYAQVQVLQQPVTATGQATLKTDYTYTATTDIANDVDPSTYPFSPPTSRDWQRGQLLKQTVYTYRDGHYVPVKIVRNQYNSTFSEGDVEGDVYNLTPTRHHLAIIPACRAYTVMAPNLFDAQGIYGGIFYYYISAFDYLRQSDETNYGLVGDSVLTSKIYTYGSSKHTQLTKVSSSGVSGDTLITRMTYPEDYTLTNSPGPLADSRLAGLQGLQRAHVKSAVIESYRAVAHASGTLQPVQAELTEYGLVNQVPLLRATWDWQTVPNGTYTPLQASALTWSADSHYLLKSAIRYWPDYSVMSVKRFAGQPLALLRGVDKEIIAQVQGAQPNQVAYTSFEPTATGRWHYDSTGTHRVAGVGRTGRWAYRLDGNVGVSRSQLPAGDYELQYWGQGAVGPQVVLSSGSNQSSGGPTRLATAPGNWYQYQTRLHVAASGQVTLTAPAGTSVLIDEVRLYPVGSRLTSYTHNPLVGMTSQTGPDGRTLTYEYDAVGRLVRTRDEQGRILAQQQYHYAGH